MATKLATLTIDNISGGYSNDFAKGTASSPATKQGTYFTGFFSPNRPNYLGQISTAVGNNPSYLPVSAGGVPINATFGSDGFGYFISPIGYLSKFQLGNLTTSPTVNDFTQPASCSNDNYKDIWMHVSSTGLESLMYTYQTAGNAYLGIAPISNIAGLRNDTAYTLTNRNVVHVGVVSAGGKSFITDGNYFKCYDPNSPASLFSVNIGLGYTMSSVADYGNYCAGIASNGNSSKMVLWKGSNQTAVDYEYDLRDFKATAIVNEGGDLRVFTYGKNGTTKIKTFTGSGFSEEADWETPTSLCAAPLHNMCDVFLNQIVWKTPDGFLWSFGSPRKNELLSGTHKWGQVSSSTNTNGCVKNLYQDILHIGSTVSGSSYMLGLKADESYSTGFITGSTISLLRTNLITLPHKSSLQRISVFFSNYTLPTPSSSGSAFSMNMYKGYDTTTDWLSAATVPILDTGDTSISTTGLVYYDFAKSIQDVDTFFLNLNFSGCTIKKIEVQYSYESNII